MGDLDLDLLCESFPGFARKRFTPSKRHSCRRSIEILIVFGALGIGVNDFLEFLKKDLTDWLVVRRRSHSTVERE